MTALLDRIRTRLVPALLTAAGVALVAAGLLTYTVPVGAQPPSDAPTDGIASAGPGASIGLRTIPPLASGKPIPSTTPPADRVATRVVVPALKIDLPVTRPPAGFPYCNVAMYLEPFSQPGLPGATYLFAHARTGMFLPLLTRSQVNNGASMLDMLAQVYTSDDQVFLYHITQVRRHLPSDTALSALPTKDGQLWLQTSEGPVSSSPKLQVVATVLSSGAADHAAAHPKPHPIVCG
jgi:hypothetical protein